MLWLNCIVGGSFPAAIRLFASYFSRTIPEFTRLTMNFSIPPQTHIERLKLAAMYLSCQRGMRRSAWGSLGWGAFTLVLGLLSRSRTPLDYVCYAIGLFLLVEGAWVLRAATTDPRVLRFEAAALLFLGLWNTVGIYFEITSGLRPIFGAQTILAGIVQMISSYSVFRSYPAYKLVYEHLDRACLYELELKIGDAWNIKTKLDPDIVEFKIDDKKSKAKFLPDIVIVLTNGGKQISLLERGKAKIISVNKKLLSKLLKVGMVLEDQKIKAEMDQKCCDRWRDWMAGNNVSEVRPREVKAS